MRWIFLLLAVIGFSLAFATKSTGLMEIGFVVGFVSLFAAFLGFAAARIASTSRPDAIILSDVSKLRAGAAKPAAQQPPLTGADK
jgi:hypothetical protein